MRFDKLLRMPTRSLGSHFVRTAGFNMANTALAGVGGIVIARVLGPAGRGDYAVLIGWMSVALIVGELGQTSAVCYHISRYPERGADFLATARRALWQSGAVATVLAVAASPVLASGHRGQQEAFVLLGLVLPISFVGAAYVFAIQAKDLAVWNWLRFSQPALWFLVVVVLSLVGRVTLPTLMIAMLISIALQTIFAARMCSRLGLTGGVASGSLRRRLLRYGFANLASAVPATLTRQVDVLLLAVLATSADVGQYSVALSYSLLSFPIASAIGSVVFPAQARMQHSGGKLVRRSLTLTVTVTAVAIVSLMLLGSRLLPLLFGQNFSESVSLLPLLVPAVFALALNQVGGDLLRGMGKPQLVAWATWLGLGVLVVSLIVLVPLFGVRGAALGSSAGQVTALAALGLALSRERAAETAGVR